MALYYDLEYVDEFPNFEAAVELSKSTGLDYLEYKSFKDRKAIRLVYKGPYGLQGESYLKLFEYCKSNSYEIELPIIERYIKGPGPIFKGNPKKYLTEIILLIK